LPSVCDGKNVQRIEKNRTARTRRGEQAA